MLRTLILLLLCAGWAAASCGTHRIQYYDLRISQNRYADALHLVLTDLEASSEEQKAFQIVAPTADEDEQALAISPATLQSGKSAACQYVASILERRHEKERDQRTVSAYHEEWVAAKTGWVGCDTEGINLEEPKEAAKVALHCLEDSSLGIHQSAIEIRAVMVKIRVADTPRLSDEDASVLLQHLRTFHESWATLEDKSSDSYYLPDIKRKDRQSFCRGVSYVRQTLDLKTEETAVWQHACRPPN